MTASCMKTTPYTPVAKGEDEKPWTTHNWMDYPALRPSSLAGVKPPSGTVLVKTGGNALQAIDRQSLEQDNVMAVTVPYNVRPGQTMLIRVPNSHYERLVTVTVPMGVHPGHVFLIRIPEPTVVTGIPVEFNDQKSALVVPSQEVSPAAPLVTPSQQVPEDLLLQEVQVEMTSNNNNSYNPPRQQDETKHSLV